MQPRPATRVSAFVDSSNLFFTMRDKLKWRMDFKKLKTFFEQFGTLVDCIYYVGTGSAPDPATDKFLHMLSHSGYSVETKPIKTIVQDDGTSLQKANLDVELVMDMFNQIDNYDLAILVSGDGDFERPLKTLRARGKQFKVLSAPGSAAVEILRLAGPHFINLADHRAALELTGRELPSVP